MKEKILELISESNNSYWDKSEGDYSDFSDKDKELVRKVDEKLANDIIKLFEDN